MQIKGTTSLNINLFIFKQFDCQHFVIKELRKIVKEN